jgi:hypothetical protein
MKINWKEVAASEGYKSLKAAYIADVERSGGWGRGKYKESCHKTFNQIICRAKHYAHFQNKTLIQVLQEWENERLSGKWPQRFENHYGSYRKHRLDTKEPSHKLGLKGIIKYYRSGCFGNDTAKSRIGDFIREALPKRDPPRKYPKARWDARDRRVREYLRKEALKKKV